MVCCMLLISVTVDKQKLILDANNLENRIIMNDVFPGHLASTPMDFFGFPAKTEPTASVSPNYKSYKFELLPCTSANSEVIKLH